MLALGQRLNERYGKGDYRPLIWLDRPVPLYEKIALYSVSDVAIVTATRDGMNLVPYEYIVCRQGSQVSLGPSSSDHTLCLEGLERASPCELDCIYGIKQSVSAGHLSRIILTADPLQQCQS